LLKLMFLTPKLSETSADKPYQRLERSISFSISYIKDKINITTNLLLRGLLRKKAGLRRINLMT
jgi:hypothetical protein